ncbi:hypothetical protein IIC68_03245 [archaeon]|nr:hypothetical protein [archaeon]
MAGIEKSSKVRIAEGKYYNTLIPKRVAEDLLGLRVDVSNQKINWKVEKGKVITELKK